MAQKITKSMHRKMQNPILQAFKYVVLSLKILMIVAGGHGGTRK